jgi:hypothetical protein
MTLNCNIPHFECFVRKEFLTNFTQSNKLIKAKVFAVTSVRGQALQFHVLTEHGAVFSRLPIHSLVWKEDYESMELEQLETYDCFSYHVTNITYDYLKYLNCVYLSGKDRKFIDGVYMTTIDFYDSEYSDNPAIAKCCHLLKLHNGCFAAAPNNRVVWQDTGIKPDLDKIDYKPLNKIFTVE